MKILLALCCLVLAISACQPATSTGESTSAQSVNGTWRLVSNIIITKGDTVVAFPVKAKMML